MFRTSKDNEDPSLEYKFSKTRRNFESTSSLLEKRALEDVIMRSYGGTDMVKLVVEIECFSMSFDEFDKETGSSDGLQPKQEDLSCVYALNEPYLHEIHVVPSKHEADQC
ncbi:hypothetical protein Tco_1459107 [Tanacetum coccineum]